MKAGKEYILLIVVIVALTAYLIFRGTNNIHYQLPTLPAIIKNDITRIELSKAGSTVVLVQKDNSWLVEPKNYLADADKVRDMLNTITGLSVSELVSEAKNEHLFDLTDDKKIAVKVWEKDALKLEFEIGKTAPSQHHTYIRLAGDPNVYQAKENFRTQFDQTEEKVREKTVLSFKQDEITEIEIVKKGQSVVIAKKTVSKGSVDKRSEDEKKPTVPPPATETVWETQKGQKADTVLVDSLLLYLSNLKCESFIEGRDKSQLANPIYAVKLKGSKEYSLSLFEKPNKDEKRYEAISSGSDYPFWLSDSQTEAIMKSPDGAKATKEGDNKKSN
jgi:hypothetical protein